MQPSTLTSGTRTPQRTLLLNPSPIFGGIVNIHADVAQNVGKLMREGYCVDMGAAYYCSDECLHTEYTDAEWAEECENNDQSYFTEW